MNLRAILRVICSARAVRVFVEGYEIVLAGAGDLPSLGLNETQRLAQPLDLFTPVETGLGSACRSTGSGG